MTAAADKLYDSLPRPLKRLTFFEGLAGADADIDAIFEIEDELDVAIDTHYHDYGNITSTDASRHRPLSRISNRRSFDRRSSSAVTASPKSSHQKSGRRDPSPVLPQQRVNSMLHRGTEVATTFTSPLAQIFQPLVVDNDIFGEDAEPEPSRLGIPGGVSYGPASRRRLSVKQRSAAAADSATNTIQRFSSIGSYRGNQEGQLFPSLDADPSLTEPETAEEVQEEESSAGGMIQWAKRLQSLEEGQKRIEDLLIGLSDGKHNK